MLELKNVKKIYKTKSGEVSALDGVSLTFPATGMVFISGKSGCGKTTLLNVIGGLDGIDSGEISLLGKSFSSFTPSEYDDYRNTFIGFIFQEYNLLSEFTVEKNIEIAMELQGRKSNADELDKLLKEVEIDQLKNRKPAELSGGQRQRVAIARALVKEPRIIMADEPTGALDSNTGMQVLEILKKLSKEKLVIVVSHDREFAEKYADRLIRLVDGKVQEDVTFTENTLSVNVRESKDTLLIKEGSDLSTEDLGEVAKAVKECKKIEVIKELSYREEYKTDQTKIKKVTEDVVLQKSKMKMKSSMALGVKSLGVKPFRLVFTILLSAVAFAVFGLFDTLANFNTKSVLDNLMRSSSSVMSLYGEYYVNYNAEDSYEVKLSQDKLDDLSKETGYKLKGVYDLKDNSTGYVQGTYSINELLNSQVTWGKNYYTKYVNGFVEFSADELENGYIKDYGYKIIGRYPQLVYEDDRPYPTLDSLQEIAISTYLAKSILHYMNGAPLDGSVATSMVELIDKKITINNNIYTIVGLIDCGDIPEKYNVLSEQVTTAKSLKVLIEDFRAFIDTGAHKCVFVADGRREYLNEQQDKVDYFYTGDCSWSVKIDESMNSRRADEFVYSARQFSVDNAFFFEEKGLSGDICLLEDEVLVHPNNLTSVYEYELSLMKANGGDVEKVKSLIEDLSKRNSAVSIEKKRQAFDEILSLIKGTGLGGEKKITVVKTSSETHKKQTVELKVVGIYVDVDTERVAPGSYYRFMMDDSLMSTLNIYTKQGDFTRFLFNPSDNVFGTKTFIDYMLNEEGLSLVWYGNSALEIIRLNEELIKQGADLFLYIALVLAAFSIFMLFNYIATSIVNKRQSIGVLRGLGSGSRDVLRMFLFESLIIALINAVLATAIAAVGCVFVNSYILNVMNISIPFAIFGIRQALIIFLMSFVTAIVSSALPIIKITREKPVDLIRRP